MRNTLLLSCLLSVLFGCTPEPGVDGPPGTDGLDGRAGDDGTDGTDGADGTDGTDFPSTAFAGTVHDGSALVADAFVRMELLDSDGVAAAVLGVATTDSAGAFAITLADLSAGNAHLRFSAETNSGVLFAHVTSLQTAVSPASTAIATLIGQLAGSEGGVAVDDFALTEVDSLVASANSALTAAATDQNDSDAVYAQVRADVGEAVADATDGAIAAGVTPTPAPAAPADVVTTADFSSEIPLTIINDAEWDMYRNGAIVEGSSDAYDDMFELSLRGVTPWSANLPDGSADSQGHIEDDNELVLGPYGIATDCNDGVDNDNNGDIDAADPECGGLCSDSAYADETSCAAASETWSVYLSESSGSDVAIYDPSGYCSDASLIDETTCLANSATWSLTHGLEVSRKVYAPDVGGWCRFVEFVTNHTAAPLTFELEVEGNLGSDGDEIFGPTSSGDAVVDSADIWHTSVEDDGGDSDPALGFLYPGGTVEVDEDDIDISYGEITLAAGQTLAVVTFGFQDPTWGPLADIGAEMAHVVAAAPDVYYEGMTAAEIAQLINVGAYGLSGDAGAVAPNAVVTIIIDALLWTTTADSDGSFSALVDASPGDTVTVTTDLGRSETLTAQ
jgi:hypothetical protein